MKPTTKPIAIYLHKSFIHSSKFDEQYQKHGKDIVEKQSGRYWEFVDEGDEYIKYETEVDICYH